MKLVLSASNYARLVILLILVFQDIIKQTPRAYYVYHARKF